MGDFNLSLDRPVVLSKVCKKANVRANLNIILKVMKLMHVPMSFVNKQPAFTRGSNILDYICIPREWLLKVKALDVLSIQLSDHSILVLDLFLSTPLFSHPPYWRFKNQLLASEGFISEIVSYITMASHSLPLDHDILGWWDLFKVQLMLISKRHWVLFKDELLQASTSTGSLQSPISPLCLRPPTKILFLRKNESEDDIEDSHDKIMDIAADYYQDLYKLNHVPSPPNSMTFGLPRVCDELVVNVDQKIDSVELESAMLSMNRNKAPGCDGITLEFYIKFWPHLGHILTAWANQVIEYGALVGSASVGILNLVNKKGDPRLLFNWRPITLISVEVKILSKALAVRLMPLVSSILPNYQCALPGRTIHSSLATVRDTIALCKIRAQPLFILALDQKKAFDRVNHNFLFHLLEVIGTPSFLVAAVRAIYTGYSCRIKNASALSRSFPYNRGIRQGDPIATALYSLAIQPVFNAIHLAVLPSSSPQVAYRSHVLLSAYADDVTVFLTDISAISVVLQAFSQVGVYSEAELNLYKSSLVAFNIPMEMRQFLQSSVQGLAFNFDSIRILGIDFTSNLAISPSQWSGILQSTRDTITLAVQYLKNLSYLSRARWVTRKLWPRWAFLFKTLQPTHCQLNQLAVVLSEAVWIGGRHWLSVNDLAVPLDKGGLDFISPRDKVKSMRNIMVAKLLQSGPESINFLLAEQILNLYAKSNLGFRLLHSHPSRLWSSVLPPVYEAAFFAWDSLPTMFFPDSKNVLMDLPCFDSKFLLQEEPQICLSPANAAALGITTIGDLCNLDRRDTRWSSGLSSAATSAIEQWIHVPRPEGHDECCVFPSGASSTDPVLRALRVPSFFFSVEDSFIHICSWNTKLMNRFYSSLRSLSFYTEVPQQTWRILRAALAPDLFKNHFWRFLLGRIPDPVFFNKIGVSATISCPLCAGSDVSVRHQFLKCHTISSALSFLTADVLSLNLPPLLDFYQLYPFHTDSHRLANFLVIALVYTIIMVSRVLSSSFSQISSDRFLQIYVAVIARHMVFFARENPPSCLDGRFRWQIYTHSNMIARFQDDVLYVRVHNGFRKYDELTHSLK